MTGRLYFCRAASSAGARPASALYLYGAGRNNCAVYLLGVIRLAGVPPGVFQRVMLRVNWVLGMGGMSFTATFGMPTPRMALNIFVSSTVERNYLAAILVPDWLCGRR
jgi:hypothetical protein